MSELLPTAELLREMRSTLASLRAAAETLESHPEMERALHDRLVRVLVEESQRLGERMERLQEALRAERRPSAAGAARLSDLMDELAETLTGLGLRCALEAAPAAIAGATLDVPAAELRREVEEFFAALRRGSRVGACSIRACPADRHVRIDLSWSPELDDLPWLLGWQGEALGGGPPGRPAGGLRALARAHDGAAWFTLDRDGGAASVRLLLPSGDAAPPAAPKTLPTV